MEIWNLPDKEFKIVVWRKLWAARKHRKIIQRNQENYRQNEEYNREIKIIKKNQTEILELKNTITEMKNVTLNAPTFEL